MEREQAQISYSAMMQERRDASKPEALRFTVGKDMEGRWVHADICSTRMRRLIVGGWGVSGFLRAMLAELAESNSPADLRLILLDGHYAEFSAFRGLPHLISEVVTDSVHAMSAFEWGMSEMERRFSLLNQKTQAGAAAYNIEQYNAVCTDEEKLPRILIVAVEVNDLVLRGEDAMRNGHAIDLINRLAMKGHAVGIHLIFATEHPVSGSFIRILQNYSHSCIAFQVNDEGASRLILGEDGAEKLSDGELLYDAGDGFGMQCIRGISISTKESERAIASAKEKYETSTLYAGTVFEDLGGGQES